MRTVLRRATYFFCLEVCISFLNYVKANYTCHTRVAESVSESQKLEVFIVKSDPKNTRSRCRIFLSDSDSNSRIPIESFFTSHLKLGISIENGTISIETVFETDNSCCVLQFLVITSCYTIVNRQTSFTFC